MRKLLFGITLVALVASAFVAHDQWVKSRTLPTVSFTLVNYPDDLGKLTDEFKDEHRPVVVLETGKDCGDPCDDVEAALATHAAAHRDIRVAKMYFEPPPFLSIGYALPMVMIVIPGYGITYGSLPRWKNVDAFLDERAAFGGKEKSLQDRIDALNAKADATRAQWVSRWRQLSNKGSALTHADHKEMARLLKQLDEHAELNSVVGIQLSRAQAELSATVRADH